MRVSFVLHHLVDYAWRYSVCPGIASHCSRAEEEGGKAWVAAGKSASMAKEALGKAAEGTPTHLS